jgi:ECF transporter S component (folate family)
MAGIFIGPVAGAFVGGCADIVGCIMFGISINPIITLGAISIGLVSGIIYRSLPIEKPKLKVTMSVFAAHVTGSMLIKSIGLYLYYHYDVSLLLFRIPLYILIGTAEMLIIYSLSENKVFKHHLQKIQLTAYK